MTKFYMALIVSFAVCGLCRGQDDFQSSAHDTSLQPLPTNSEVENEIDRIMLDGAKEPTLLEPTLMPEAMTPSHTTQAPQIADSLNRITPCQSGNATVWPESHCRPCVVSVTYGYPIHQGVCFRTHHVVHTSHRSYRCCCQPVWNHRGRLARRFR